MLSERDVTGRRRAHRPARPRRRHAAGFFDDLKAGDYVVHVQHGVARYGGMVTRTMGGTERDYLLRVPGGDKLYVPSDQIDAVRHHTGGDTPTLHRMGGVEWQRAKAQARSATREIAKELVVLYQQRASTPGHAFSPDTPWQTEMEEAFPYVETPDQARAIVEVKADMEQPCPMDRLICGDVGFGKTEIALRAVLKAVQDGVQVAVLVPTTLLAQQHGTTFSERFAPYPVRVEVLSRFLTPGQVRTVVQGVADGAVDVVIGTHRLLSADVAFKRLGLLVVDEEQRFGVGHKEAIKALKANVDVLTLSATPIPRTLEMSLTGIRDSPCCTRRPPNASPSSPTWASTTSGRWPRPCAGSCCARARSSSCTTGCPTSSRWRPSFASWCPRPAPPWRMARWTKAAWRRLLDFWHGDHDVLVCTTIIESGIDMPTVNTLVVDRADRLGLGQLHQLRGRVGRAGSRAYAYLFHPRDHALSEDAYERLKTIGEATELGSGFKIAMRDLEIRGAGHLLGESQSGHIAAVGYDLYVQMVSEAVAELKGERTVEPGEVTLDLPVDAHLPAGYVAREELRLEAYRRLAGVVTAEEVADVRGEWEDRYGPVPAPAEALLAVARLRAECHRTGVRQVVVSASPVGKGLVARLSPVRLRPSGALRLRRLHREAIYREELGQLVVPLAQGGEVATVLTGLLGALLPEQAPAVAS